MVSAFSALVSIGPQLFPIGPGPRSTAALHMLFSACIVVEAAVKIEPTSIYFQKVQGCGYRGLRMSHLCPSS